METEAMPTTIASGTTGPDDTEVLERLVFRGAAERVVFRPASA